MNNNQEVKKTVSTKRAILFYIISSLFLIFEMAVQVSPSVMTNDLMRDLNIGAFALGLMSGFYFYTYTVMQIPSGLLFDRYKPRTIITFSILICALGSLVFGLATNYYFGCLARLLTGFGSAFAFVSVLVVASDLFDNKYFALLTGITQMLAAFGAMLGQMPVSLLVHALGWRHTMFLLSAIGGVLALTVWLLMNYEKQEQMHCRFSTTPKIVGSLKTIIKSPQTWFIALYACLLWAPMSGFASLWGVQFLSKADDLTANSAAFYCSFMWLGLALASPLLGLLANALNSKRIPLILSAVIGVVSFACILEMHLTGVILAFLLACAGASCSGQALSFALVRDNNAYAIKGTAIAFNNMAVVISGAIVQPLIGHFISGNTLSTVKDYALSDYKKGLMVILIAYLAASITSIFFIKENALKTK